MLKNITFSADLSLIKRGRQQAKQEGKTLNDAFREWLKRYVGGSSNLKKYEEVMKNLSHVKVGKNKFSRDQLNER